MPIRLDWIPPSTGHPILSYNIFKRIGPGTIDPGSNFLTTVPGFQTTFDDPDYVKATLTDPGYLYVISANNSAGEGVFSNSVLVTFEFIQPVYAEPWNSIIEFTVNPLYSEPWEGAIDLELFPVYLEQWNDVLPSTPTLEYLETWET